MQRLLQAPRRFRRKSLIYIILGLVVLIVFASIFGSQKLPSTPSEKALSKQGENVKSTSSSYQSTIDLIVFAKYADRNSSILEDLDGTIRSILLYSSISIRVNVVADSASFDKIARMFAQIEEDTTQPCPYTLYDTQSIERKLHAGVRLLRKFFLTNPIEKYNNDIFFLTPSLHLFFTSMKRAIVLDIDVRFLKDIRELWELFSNFAPENIIGIGNFLQPLYRSKFAAFRKKNVATDVGSPRPGKPGFNSGVMLMDFARMRTNRLYGLYLTEKRIRTLRDKYEFYGNHAQQDFFTLLGMQFPQLFYVLDCQWNRQLDMTWYHLYPQEIFDEYHKCPGYINVYHANGDSQLPQELL